MIKALGSYLIYWSPLSLSYDPECTDAIQSLLPLPKGMLSTSRTRSISRTSAASFWLVALSSHVITTAPTASMMWTGTRPPKTALWCLMGRRSHSWSTTGTREKLTWVCGWRCSVLSQFLGYQVPLIARYLTLYRSIKWQYIWDRKSCLWGLAWMCCPYNWFFWCFWQ